MSTLSTGHAQTSGTGANASDLPKDLVPGPYVGIATGLSRLEPETAADDDLEVNVDSQSSYQLTLGVDLANWMSLELHAADLGDVDISDGSNINYREFGLSALIYAGGARDRFNRHGWTIFGRTGVGFQDSDVSDEENIDVSEGPHWLLGAGAEFALRNGLGLRAEAIAFDEDASLVQIGVIYRLGKTIELSRDSRQSSDDPQSDSDEDGVVFADDNCPDTPSNIAVDENGCAVFNGVVDGVEFLPASAKLTPGARTVLNTVADSLIELADARALIAAHTDSAGDAGVNMQLSQWRAFEVARYLVNRGVDAARLEARAFGETRPIDVNSTSQGRRNNRRVEITLIAE